MRSLETSRLDDDIGQFSFVPHYNNMKCKVLLAFGLLLSLNLHVQSTPSMVCDTDRLCPENYKNCISKEAEKITVYDKNFTFDSLSFKCPITEEIDASFIGLEHFEWTLELQNLKTLDLSDNKIESFNLTSTKGLISLKFVNLADNLLKKLSAAMFPSCPSLATLHIFNNPFQNVSFVDTNNMRNVLGVIIGDENLQKLDKSCFSGFHNLRTFEIRNTKFNSISLWLNIKTKAQLEFRSVDNLFKNIDLTNTGGFVHLHYSNTYENVDPNEHALSIRRFKTLDTCLMLDRVIGLQSIDLTTLNICKLSTDAKRFRLETIAKSYNILLTLNLSETSIESISTDENVVHYTLKVLDMTKMPLKNFDISSDQLPNLERILVTEDELDYTVKRQICEFFSMEVNIECSKYLTSTGLSATVPTFLADSTIVPDATSSTTSPLIEDLSVQITSTLSTPSVDPLKGIIILGGVALTMVVVGLVLKKAYKYFNRQSDDDYYCYYNPDNFQLTNPNEQFSKMEEPNTVNESRSNEQDNYVDVDNSEYY